jgi:peptide/nickel transport system permease protein
MTPAAIAPRLRGAFRRWGLLAVGGAIVLVFVLSALLAPWIAPRDPYELDVAVMLQGPSPEHPLGTDELGRDVLSRTIHAARISVQVALIAVAVGLIGGTLIGLVAAYFGGWVDAALMRLMELLFSFPAILLAVILMASLGTSVLNAMLAIGIIFIPGFARLARASAESVMRQQYVEQARAIGMSHLRIVTREILPNIVAPLLVEAAVAFSYAVLLESALSFLGLGAQPPDPSWGNMLNTGRGFMAQAPWLSLAPGAAIFLTVLGFNMLGDGLRDAFDPHLRDE